MALPIVLVLAYRSTTFFRVWGVIFGLSTALDAYFNGAWSPIRSTSVWATVSGIVFVYLGDLRLYSAVLWDGTRRSLVRALALAWVTPLASQVIRTLLPALTLVPRRTYLAYEVIFLLVLWWGARHPNLAALRHGFARRVIVLFATQYALWIVSDLVILSTGSDWAYGLRMVPDVLYYAAFVPYVLWCSWSRVTPSPSSLS